MKISLSRKAAKKLESLDKRTKVRIAAGIQQIPDGDIKALIFELVVRLLPDDIATKEDLLDIEQARLEHARGETIGLEAINMN